MKTLKIIITAFALVATLFATVGMTCEDIIEPVDIASVENGN